MAEAKIYVPRSKRRARPAPTTRFTLQRGTAPAAGGVSIYVWWSFPGEANRDVTELDNRFSTMTEVRRVEWPNWESPEWSSPTMFQQGIAGALELFFRAWLPFQQLVEEVTGHVVPVFQRVDQAGYRLPLDERVLADADTLFVFGLDHLLTNRKPRRRRSKRCAVAHARGNVSGAGPASRCRDLGEPRRAAMEYAHHGDALVPRQQRFGKYTRSLMKGLGVRSRIVTACGPGVVKGTTTDRAVDDRSRSRHARLARGRHQLQLPQAPAPLRGDDGRPEGRSRARATADRPVEAPSVHRSWQPGIQLVRLDASRGQRAGEILLADSTVFSTLFGADDSLKRFWKNLVTAK